MINKPQLIICQSEVDFSIAKKLTFDYLKWLEMDLVYQGVETELDTLNKMYNRPTGAFIYILIDNKIAGGGGIRFLEKGIAEMKRLFIYDSYRGKHLGELLCTELIKVSKDLGYKKIRLDTVSKLKAAIQLYQKAGFYEIAAYCDNPDTTAKFMELVL